jgi:CBS-domain-containing membrane protein
MQQEFVTVDPRDLLQTALARLQNCDCHTLLVLQEGRLLGLVTADHLAEVLMIQEALHSTRRPGHAADRADGRDRPELRRAVVEPSTFAGLPRANTSAGNGTIRR